MRPGYNHNILYKNLVLHVQTEDLGPTQACYCTHLFHKGLIIKTLSQTYPHTSNPEELHTHIVENMQAQHKTMLKHIFSGTLDKELGLINT